ncbi:MAG: T9SS type A sorting domain-containing protein, partial [Ignavibacteria bacterium]
CIVWDNTQEQFLLDNSSIDIAFSNIQEGWTGIGNIDSDPQFTNSSQTDFHLQDSSPCIGAGIDEIEINGTTYFAPEFDIEGNPRPNPLFSMPDMGAYENPLGAPQVGAENSVLNIENMELTNYPNPFNPSTTISFNLTAKDAKDAKVEIYNLKGQKIREFSIFNFKSSIVWDGTDQTGKPVSSGIYFAKLKAGKTKTSCKMLLLK